MSEKTARSIGRTFQTALCVMVCVVMGTFPAISRAQDVPLTVSITKLVQIGADFDNPPFPAPDSLGDLYAEVTIDGVTLDNFDDRCQLPPEIFGGFLVPFTMFGPDFSIDECLNTPWVFSSDITPAPPWSVAVRIKILDDDAVGASDTGDANPSPGKKVLDLAVNTTTATWTGDAEWPGDCAIDGQTRKIACCAKGTGGKAVEVCWEIALPDSDGDGLFDVAEEVGMDTDDDGVIDLDLPGFGADPTHKDLFVELDWMPGEEPLKSNIQRVKNAFAAAPIDAGGTPNPDGQPGIRVWFDTGDLADPLASEDGALVVSSCADGIDNGGDGLTDLNDPDCLVGDNLGGGNEIPASPDICNLQQIGGPFYDAKAANFDAASRALVFRYGIFPIVCPNNSPGGQGELGGNDFIVFNDFSLEASTLMHEIGHTLNLGHGGLNGRNCKPNYVSIMNYDHQGGIDNLLGPAVLDFSPPRFAGGRGVAPLDELVEEALDEAIVLDPTDTANLFVFVNAQGWKVMSPLSAAVDWNGDGNTLDSGLAVNIDTSDSVTELPTACTNPEITDASFSLKGHDDWANISLPFRQFGDSLDAPVNLVETPEPTSEEILAHKQTLNTTDLSLAKTTESGPVEVGTETQLTHTLTMTNNGLNPALALQVVDTLSPEVSFVGSTESCEETVASTIVCESDALLAGEARQFDITVVTSGACVNGIPTDIINTAAVVNIAEFAGEDLEPSDNEATATTAVVDTTRPELTVSAISSALWPPNHKMVDVGLSVEASDICDTEPDISIRVTSDEATATAPGAGGGKHAPDAQITADGRVLLGAERSGDGDGRVYVIQVTATDASGNSASSSVSVRVGHSQNKQAVDSGQNYDATQIN